jgi:hypothetical protein
MTVDTPYMFRHVFDAAPLRAARNDGGFGHAGTCTLFFTALQAFFDMGPPCRPFAPQ